MGSTIRSDRRGWDEAQHRESGFGVSCSVPNEISAERGSQLTKLVEPMLKELFQIPVADRLDTLAILIDFYIRLEMAGGLSEEEKRAQPVLVNYEDRFR